MAIAAAYSLEIRQYDAINAFCNADIEDDIYCHCPEGFEKEGLIWKLSVGISRAGHVYLTMGTRMYVYACAIACM